ncbi:MAG: peptidylprolyl isomerase [Candidatus Thiodiazotropha sp.]
MKILLLALLLLFSVHAHAENGGERVVVEGFGFSVSDRELRREVEYLLSKKASLGTPNLKTMERISGEMLINKQLLKEAEELGLEDHPDVQYEIQRARLRALVKARMDQFSGAELTESDQEILAKEYWHTHQSEFKTKSKRALSHILITLRGRGEDEAAAVAEQIHKKLVEKPESFEALVEEFSEDPGSKKRKGSLGLAESDRFVPEFSKAAFSLKAVGDISEPVKTRYGYHLIRVDEIVAEKMHSYDEVKDTVREKAVQDYVKSRQQQHLTSLQASSNRKIYPDEVKRVWEKMFTGQE